MRSRDVVFLFDVDNTLVDNDRVQNDLRKYLERESGPENGIGVGQSVVLAGRNVNLMKKLPPSTSYGPKIGTDVPDRNHHDRFENFVDWLR
jgi:hypothetical protein